MVCLLGNTESRTVYHNFHLGNLNSDTMDPTHLQYQRYLENQFFVPPGDNRFFFSHYVNNTIPAAPNFRNNKGRFNVFPLSLVSDSLHRATASNSSLGKTVKKKKRLFETA
jgi:hypothetical protein